MIKQSVSQTAQEEEEEWWRRNGTRNSADNFECIRGVHEEEEEKGRQGKRGRAMRIKINKSGNDIKKTCGSIFFQADPSLLLAHTSCLHYPPPPPATTPLPCAPFHFILATHAKCVACFRGDAARYPFTVAHSVRLSRCPRLCIALLICIEGRPPPYNIPCL